MKSPLSTLVAFGIVAALFLALMSMFYLQQIPTAEDLRRLESEVRREHGIYLASADPIIFTLLRPTKEGDRTGVRVVCSLRPDILKRPSSVDSHLDRIGLTILQHPDMRGRIAYVTMVQPEPFPRERTVRRDTATPRIP